MKEGAGASAIDRTVLDGIRSLEGPEAKGLLVKVIAVYLADSPGLLGRIRSAAEAGDAESLRRCAHAMKSSSANVGARRVSEISRKIEEDTGAGTPPDARASLVAKLEEDYRSARKELEAVLAGGSGEASLTR